MLFLHILQYVFILLMMMVIVFPLSFVVYLMFVHKKYSHIPGPKRTSFIFGNSDYLSPSSGITLPETVYNLHLQYGPVFVLFLLHNHFISVFDPKAARELLMDIKYIKPSVINDGFKKVFGQRYMGKGLLGERNNQEWKRHRKIFNPAFNRKYIIELMDVFNDSADRLVKYLSAKADGKTEVELSVAFEKASTDIIAKAGFGMEEEMILCDTPFHEAIQLSFEALSLDQRSPLFFLDPRKSAVDFRKRARNAIQLLRKTGEMMIRKRIEDQSMGKTLPKDILSFILKAPTADEDLTVEEMVDEFITFFAAGQETTGNTLAFTMLALGQYPEVLKKLLEEVDSVICDKEEITHEDISKLEYMTLVLKETMRFYPPVFGVGRIVPTDMQMAGIRIPAGSDVHFVNYAWSRMEENFKDPLQFDPERFLRVEEQRSNVYFPFSMGPRSCIGQQFAMIELKVVITKLLQKLNFKLVPGQNFGLKEKLNVKPADGCLSYITLRNK